MTCRFTSTHLHAALPTTREKLRELDNCCVNTFPNSAHYRRPHPLTYGSYLHRLIVIALSTVTLINITSIDTSLVPRLLYR